MANTSDANEYIYIIRPTRLQMLTDGATPDEQRLVGEHFAYLKSLVDRGVGQLVGRTMTSDERTIGIMLFRAESLAAAEELAACDPAVKGNVFHVDVQPFATLLKAPVFES